MAEKHGIETYRVGFFHDLHILRRRLVNPGGWWGNRRDGIRAFARNFARSWRRRSYWNGYLAEWHYCPVGVMHSRCGRGWTRRAALRRLGEHIVGSNLMPTSESAGDR